MVYEIWDLSRLQEVRALAERLKKDYGRNGLGHRLKHRLYYLRKRTLLAPAQGSATIVYLPSSDDVVGVTGRYYKEKKEKRSSDISSDKEIQKSLWASSVGLSGIDL